MGFFDKIWDFVSGTETDPASVSVPETKYGILFQVLRLRRGQTIYYPTRFTATTGKLILQKQRVYLEV